MSVINQREIKVGIDIIAQVDMMPAEVRMKRGLDVAVFTALGKYFLQISFLVVYL